ncbi:MAG: type II secretion system F family protein [Bacteroidota bacterium]
MRRPLAPARPRRTAKRTTTATRRRPAQSAARPLASLGLARRVPARALAESTRALAVMVGARLPLVDALDGAARQASSRPLRDALSDAARLVRRGGALSDALARHPSAFGPVLPEVVRVGETSGTLGEALARVADDLEKTAALRRKVALALVYPALVVVVAVGAVAFLLAFVVPTFAELFADVDAPLPAPTRLVLLLSDGLRDHALLIGLGVLGGGLGLRAGLATEAGARAWDAVRLRLPILGSLAVKGHAARLARTLATLLGSGVPLVDTLGVAAGASGNRVLRGVLKGARRAVARGGSLAPQLAASRFVPPLLVQMATVGEETGELASVMKRTADHFEQEVDGAVDVLTSVIEPALIVVLGLVVGGVLVAIYLPMFDMVTVLE